MNILQALKSRTRRILVTAIAAVVAVASVFILLQPILADSTTPLPPPVPDNLKPPVGSKLFLVGHATGTQNYICLPAGAGFAFALFTPEATLLDEEKEQIITHFFSVNPDPSDNGAIRATWLDSRDSSRVWAAVAPNGASTDEKFVEKGAIAWLLLLKVGVLDGPTGGDRLTNTVAVQRLNTHAGSAPSTGCAKLADVGTKAFVPYTADYFFYK